MTISRETSKGQLVALVFGQDAVAASQTDAQLPAVGPEEGGITAGYIMPFPGEVVALSAELTAGAAAGVLTLGATVDGTEDADTTMTITTETGHYQTVRRGLAPFAAGDEIGCELTTDGNWDATTADLNAVVWVLLQLDGI